MAIQSVIGMIGMELSIEFEGNKLAIFSTGESLVILAIAYIVVQACPWILFVAFGGASRFTTRAILLGTAYFAVVLATVLVPTVWIIRWRASR